MTSKHLQLPWGCEKNVTKAPGRRKTPRLRVWIPTAPMERYPLVIFNVTIGKSPFFMGKSTISTAISNSYVKLPEGIMNDHESFRYVAMVIRHENSLRNWIEIGSKILPTITRGSGSEKASPAKASKGRPGHRCHQCHGWLMMGHWL